jgi:hypothetical protein
MSRVTLITPPSPSIRRRRFGRPQEPSCVKAACDRSGEGTTTLRHEPRQAVLV